VNINSQKYREDEKMTNVDNKLRKQVAVQYAQVTLPRPQLNPLTQWWRTDDQGSTVTQLIKQAGKYGHVAILKICIAFRKVLVKF
jgi:hypothetical protein